jgi:hypothetical protein
MIFIFAHKNSKRLQYIIGLIFGELMGFEYKIITNADEFKNLDDAKFSYSVSPIENALFLSAKNILFETDIRHQEFKNIEFGGISCPYAVFNSYSVMPFDVLAASFYLVTRYEEYLPHKKDHHKRFPASESCAFQSRFLHKPSINIWAKELKERILFTFPELKSKASAYSFIPTYDIDIAWSYQHKGILRTVGGLMRDLWNGQTSLFRKRVQVLRGKEQDPYDTYALQKQLAKKYQLKAIYFFLFAEPGPYDKSISPLNKHYQYLVKDIRDMAKIGIHPSYQSNEDQKQLKNEIRNLADAAHTEITRSRQHFLKLTLPHTYRNLLSLGIQHDFTMGYADQPGFRAGICTPFYFYDLDMETDTRLQIHPFAIMDGTLRDYLKTDIESAKTVISQLINEVKAVDGQFISLWHNESLSNEGKWCGWLDVYEHLLKEATRD